MRAAGGWKLCVTGSHNTQPAEVKLGECWEQPGSKPCQVCLWLTRWCEIFAMTVCRRCCCCRYGAALFIKPNVVRGNAKRWAAFDAHLANMTDEASAAGAAGEQQDASEDGSSWESDDEQGER